MPERKQHLPRSIESCHGYAYLCLCRSRETFAELSNNQFLRLFRFEGPKRHSWAPAINHPSSRGRVSLDRTGHIKTFNVRSTFVRVCVWKKIMINVPKSIIRPPRCTRFFVFGPFGPVLIGTYRCGETPREKLMLRAEQNMSSKCLLHRPNTL